MLRSGLLRGGGREGGGRLWGGRGPHLLQILFTPYLLFGTSSCVWITEFLHPTCRQIIIQGKRTSFTDISRVKEQKHFNRGKRQFIHSLGFTKLRILTSKRYCKPSNYKNIERKCIVDFNNIVARNSYLHRPRFDCEKNCIVEKFECYLETSVGNGLKRQ